MGKDEGVEPPPTTPPAPDTTLIDKRIKVQFDAFVASFGGGGGGNGVSGTISDGNARLSTIEREVREIKGALDWAKIAFSMLVAVVLAAAGFTYNLGNKFDSFAARLADELRAQRTDQVGQVTAISNAITATKQQQAPQVIILPAPPEHDLPKRP